MRIIREIHKFSVCVSVFVNFANSILESKKCFNERATLHIFTSCKLALRVLRKIRGIRAISKSDFYWNDSAPLSRGEVKFQLRNRETRFAQSRKVSGASPTVKSSNLLSNSLDSKLCSPTYIYIRLYPEVLMFVFIFETTRETRGCLVEFARFEYTWRYTRKWHTKNSNSSKSLDATCEVLDLISNTRTTEACINRTNKLMQAVWWKIGNHGEFMFIGWNDTDAIKYERGRGIVQNDRQQTFNEYPWMGTQRWTISWQQATTIIACIYRIRNNKTTLRNSF